MTDLMRLFSTLTPAPPGFDTRRLKQPDLLLQPAAVYARSHADIYALLGDKLPFFSGVIIQPGPAFKVEPRDENLWLIDSPASTFTILSDICHPLLALLSRANGQRDKLQEQDIVLARTAEALEVTRADYQRITGRMQGQVKQLTGAREQIAASQNRLVQIINLMPQLIFATDTAGTILLCNQALADQYNALAGTLIGKTERQLGAPREWVDACDEANQQVFNNGCRTDINELARYHRDGSRHHYQLTKIPFVWSGSADPAVLTIATDISARRKAEMAVMDLNQVLEQRVEDRTLELEEANRQLRLSRDTAEQASHAKSRFLANMSHEIRTPMNGVIGLLELLQQTALNDDQQSMVATARDSANSLLGILNDILDFSKIEAGQLELESIPLCLEEVVESVAETLAPSAHKKRVQLYCEVDPAIPRYLIGDRMRLRQILFNLCGNAIKFTSSEFKTGQVFLLAKLIREDIHSVTVSLQIQDNGLGMDDVVLKNLFTPFSQAETSTTRRYGGTGLGLSICKQLVDLMSADISVQSTPHLGTEFRVLLTLPVDKADTDHLYSLAGVTVLNTLADAKTAHLVTRYLEAAGARVVAAPGDATAPAAAPGETHRVLLCAAGPRDDLAKRVRGWRQRYGRPDLPVVALVPRSNRHLSTRIRHTVFVHNHPVRRKHLLAAVHPDSRRRRGAGRDAVRQATPTATRGGLRILVAEDNPTNQLVIKKQLEKLGFQPAVVANGLLALDYWQNHPVDLILTDCHMPEMDGFQLTAAIRRAEAGADRIPIIAITANALKGEADRCLAADMDDYLSKPVSLLSLGEKIEKWLPLKSEST